MSDIISWLVNSSEDFQFIFFFGLLTILVIIEQLFHLRDVVRKRRWKANFILTLISVVVMISVPVSFITAAGYAEKIKWGIFNYLEINWVIAGILTLLFRGFISFFTHLLMHKFPIFWRIHRVHHLDTEMDVSTTVRFHPFEFLVNLIIGVPIILAMGFPVWALLLYELLDVGITLFSHSNITLPHKIEKYLRYVIVTPDLHRVHHSSFQPETDSNFSAVFPVWDIIFGTFRTDTEVPQKEMDIGLEEVRDERTSNVAWLLLSPFKSMSVQEEKNAD